MPSLNLDLDFFDHPKTKRLIGLLGRGAEVLPIKLWAYCGKFHSKDGKLTDYTEQEIESIAGWWGETGKMMAALIRCGLIEPDGTGFKIHDWEFYQGHIEIYKRRALNAAKARWDASSIASRNATHSLKQCLDPVLQSNVLHSNVLSCSDMDGDSNDESDWETNSEPRELTGKKCVFCGASEEMTGRAHQIDHFYPRVAGGSNNEDNLLVACVPCNGAKQGRVFKSIEDCRTWLHWRFWASSRQRYVKHRRYAFDGKGPSQSETELGVELNSITVAQPSNSKLYGTGKKSEVFSKDRIPFPSRQEVLAYAPTILMLESEAILFFDHFQSTSWIDKNGHFVTDWQAKCRTWNTNAKAKTLEEKKGNPQSLKAIEEAIATHEANQEYRFYDKDKCTEEMRANLDELKRKRKKILTSL